jgi:hypothetical protein
MGAAMSIDTLRYDCLKLAQETAASRGGKDPDDILQCAYRYFEFVTGQPVTIQMTRAHYEEFKKKARE